MTYAYRLFGLDIASTMPLPDLEEATGVRVADVLIDQALIEPAGGTPEPEGLSSHPRGALLNVAGVGRFLIGDGRRISVEPAPAATDRNIRLYLLGSAFGAVLHQRGLLPLHANVIDVDGIAVAFMGHSGAGKSTLASWFHDRGYPVLGDDVCVVAPDAQGGWRVELGLPRMRLWGDALAASGRTSTDYTASFDDMDKYDVPTTVPRPTEPRRLAAIYDLRKADQGTAPSIVSLTGIGAIGALVANTYRGAFISMLGDVKRHLDQCIALSRAVPVFALQRRWGMGMFAEEGEWIEAHVKSLTGE